MNALAIEEAIQSGNMREQMTLVYCTIFSFLMNEVMDNPGMIDKINAKLSGFQIDKALLEKETREGTGLIDAFRGGKKLKQIPEVENFRHVEKARLKQTMAPASALPHGQKMGEVEGLSMRERRVGTEYAASDKELRTDTERRLRWIPGKEWYYAAPTSNFAKTAEALGDLPVLTGPSGTTDGLLHMSTYLGFGDRLQEGTLACAGWMVPVGDHTLHEVCTTANYYGSPYSGLPEDFTSFYSKDPQVQKDIDERLAKQGLMNPSHYFSAQFQRQVAADLGHLDQATVKVELTLDQELEKAAAAVTVHDLPKLAEATPVKEKIKGFNLQLRQIEAQKIKLEELETTHSSNPKMLEAIRNRGLALNSKYNALAAEKIEYVKKNVKPENQVYALVNPRMLAAGLELYTANKPEKVLNILFNHGFQRYTVGNTLPATGYASGFQSDVNEMGNVGRYFSVGSPAYLDGSKLAIKCETTKTQLGAAIMSITELRAAGFTADQIEKGYKRIQDDFPFLQNDGLPPKDTEVVFLRPEGNLEPKSLLEGTFVEDITWTGSFQDYYDRSKGGVKAPDLHPTWQSMPKPTVTPDPVIPKATVLTESQVAEAAVEKALEGIADGVVAYDLDKLAVSTPVKAKLKTFNLELRKIEALQIHLAQMQSTNTGKPAMLAAIRKKKIALNKQYNTLVDQKVLYVKANISTDKQVYALANPRLLDAGLDLYTANKPKKILDILFNHGFQRYTVGNTLPATGYSTGFQDDVNEMGNVGRYFSVGSPGYLDSSKVAIKCQTNAPQMGTAIMSITELRARGFTAEQIEQGYKSIQNDFPFLQNDGLPPKDTEIVYLRPEGHLTFTDTMMMGSEPSNITWSGTVTEYYEQILAEDNPPTTVHGTWTAMPRAPRLATGLDVHDLAASGSQLQSETATKTEVTVKS